MSARRRAAKTRSKTTPSRVQKRRPRQAEETIWEEVSALKRERILAEAADLFATRGYLGTTIDAIAERMKATKPFIYYHVRAKIDLLIELCQRGTRETLDVVNAAIADKTLSCVERLDRYVRDFTASALRNHRYVHIYFREEINLPKEHADTINRMRKEIDRKLTKLLEEGKASGEFKIEDASLSCLIINGMISYAFAWYREDGRLSQQEIGERMARMVLNMVSAQPIRA